MGDFLIQHTRSLVVVRLPVLNVLLATHHIKIARHQRLRPTGSSALKQLAHALINQLQVSILLLHLGGTHLARVNIGANHCQLLASGQNQIRFQPTPRIDVGLHSARASHAVAHLRHLDATVLTHRNRHARATLNPARQHVGLIAGQQTRRNLTISAHLLQQQHLRGALLQPLAHTFTGSGPNPINVDGNNTHKPRIAKPALTRVLDPAGAVNAVAGRTLNRAHT